MNSQDKSEQQLDVSSPAATGGAGPVFEQHVGGYWLAQLLVGAIPPILTDSSITEVDMQTERLGWHTDDFLVVCENNLGRKRRLACQVKRSVTISSEDEDFQKVIQDAWKDFTNPGTFQEPFDRFALITLRGTNALLEHLSGLLDFSRVARAPSEFTTGLQTRGFLSSKSVRYCAVLRTVIEQMQSGKPLTAEELWRFLRVFHVLILDLGTDTGQHEAMLINLLALSAADSQRASETAKSSWTELVQIAGKGMASAGTFRRANLPEVLRKKHSLIKGAQDLVFEALRSHSSPILNGIHSTIGSTCHLPRGVPLQEIIQRIQSTQVVIVSGAAGSGKSALAKAALDTLSREYFGFCFRGEEFAQPHFDITLQNSQIPASAQTLAAFLAGHDRKILLIESVERLLEKSTRDALFDLLTLVAVDKSWRVILTCRDYSTDLVESSFLDAARVEYTPIRVPLLDDKELEIVEKAYPQLSRAIQERGLRAILRNPYFLDKALQITWSQEKSLPLNEREFRHVFWRQVITASDQAAAGMPRRRGVVFMQVALRRARALSMYADAHDLDGEALDKLRFDSLTNSPPTNDQLVSPAHDVLED